MAIIVMHRKSEQNFVFLGAGYGSWATEKPGILGFADKKEGADSRIYVCGDDGRIIRMRPAEVVVVSIDGQPVADVLGHPPSSSGLP